MDRDGANHSSTKTASAHWLRDGKPLVTNNDVLLEASALLQHRLGVSAVRAFYEDVVPIMQVDWISEQQYRAGVEAMLSAGRKKLNVVDCVSFHTMRRHGLRQAFCFDAPFRDQGAETTP